MATLSVNGLNLNPQPIHHHHIFSHNLNRGLHPRYQSTDMDTIGSISALPPQHHQLNYHRHVQEDLVHILPKGAYTDKDNDFCIYLDVGLFAPEELTVKIVNDHLIIEGIHEERQAHDLGYVQRHFKRRYDLPKGYNPDAVVSKLSSDGVLNVILPKTIKNREERIIPIQHTGPSNFFFKHKFDNDDMDKTKNTNENDEDVKKENGDVDKTKNANKKVELKDEKEKKANQK